jgi:phage tail-like protein
MSRKDPLLNCRFRVEIDGMSQAGFSEVSFADMIIDLVDYREGSDPGHVRKLPGLTRMGNVTLKLGVTDSMELFKWYADTAALGHTNAGNRRNVVVVVMDEAGQDKARFVVREAWPIKYAVGSLNAKGNDVLIETLELVNEGIERVS